MSLLRLLVKPGSSTSGGQLDSQASGLLLDKVNLKTWGAVSTPSVLKHTLGFTITCRTLAYKEKRK